MRWVGAAASSLLVAGVLLAPVAPAAATEVAFRGSWVSIDPGDGSNQSLTISGSGATGKHSVVLRDDVASVACGGARALVPGTGTVSGDTLTWFFTVNCPGSGRPPVNGRVGPGLLTYVAMDDTLVDDAGAIWHRV
jgi:hypothetical protein